MIEYMPYIWIGLAVILAVFEGCTVQLVSIWFMFGAICSAVTSAFTDSVPIQIAVFFVVSIVSLVATRPLAKKLIGKKGTVKTNSNRLIGETGTMISDIQDTDDIARVKIAGEVWSAKSDIVPILKNTKIKVVAIEGVKLIVEPMSN
jgi:membrane protein implicated in regulation of membrane protease activity